MPDDLLALDLYDAQNDARVARAMTLRNVDNLLYVAERLTLIVEGEIESYKHQDRACAGIAIMRDCGVEIAEALHELAARYDALLAMARELRSQRDLAVRQASRFFDEMVDQIARVQGCPRDQAYRLALVLLNPDEEVMESDLCGLEDLLMFRDGLQELLDEFEGFS